MANLSAGTSESGDRDKTQHISAEHRALLSSCEPEAKELVHQLDMFISARCGQWEEQVTTLKKLLEKKEEEVQHLQVALNESRRKEEQLNKAANRRETEYRAHSADCEAQLVRLRSQVTRLSRSFEHLKDKHHQERQGSSTIELSKMKQELEMTKLNLYHSNEELKKALARLSEREGGRGPARECRKGKFEVHQDSQKDLERMLYETRRDVEERVVQDGDSAAVYTPLQPTTNCTQELLTQLLDKHFAQLNEELLGALEHS